MSYVNIKKKSKSNNKNDVFVLNTQKYAVAIY